MGANTCPLPTLGSWQTFHRQILMKNLMWGCFKCGVGQMLYHLYSFHEMWLNVVFSKTGAFYFVLNNRHRTASSGFDTNNGRFFLLQRSTRACHNKPNQFWSLNIHFWIYPWQKKTLSILDWYMYTTKGNVQKNKRKKKLTSVSFAFTHTHTLGKLTFFLFFPKRTWKILKNCKNAKTRNTSLSHVTCGWL